MSQPEVLILGGGFAGLSAAKALTRAAQKGECSVTLLDASTETAMVPALPDYATGLVPRNWITAPIRHLLPACIDFDQTNVTQIRFADNSVETTTGNRSFQYLIIASGAAAATPPALPGQIEQHTLTNLREADQLKTAFDHHLQQPGTAAFLISGAGYTGVELAICAAQRVQQERKTLEIHLLEMRAEIMPFLSASQQKRVLASIARHNIHLHTSCQIASVAEQCITLSDGCTVQNPLLCRTEGTCASVPLDAQEVESLCDGRTLVQPSLALAAYPNVFLAGDAAGFSTPHGHLRKAVNFAFYAGSHAGKNVIRKIQNRPVRPFHPIDLGWVIPLGDDSVGKAFGNLPLLGKAGLSMHYVMCGYRNYSLINFLHLAGHAVRVATRKKKTRNKEQA